MWFTGFKQEYKKPHAAEGRQFSLLNSDAALIRVPQQFHFNFVHELRVLANSNQVQLN